MAADCVSVIGSLTYSGCRCLRIVRGMGRPDDHQHCQVRSARGKKASLYDIDLEKGEPEDGSADESSEEYRDPYLSPTWQLYSFLRLGRPPPTSQPVYNPFEKLAEASDITTSDASTVTVVASVDSPAKSPMSVVRPTPPTSSCFSIDAVSQAALLQSTPRLAAQDDIVPLLSPPPACLDRSGTLGRVSCKPYKW